MKLYGKDKSINTPYTVVQEVIGVALAAALLLLIPLTAKLITDEMNWSLFDFVTAWILFFGAGLTYRLITRKGVNKTYNAAAGLAVATALFLVWSNIAVGLIGSEDNPANVMYGGVLAVLFLGTIIARFKPKGMAWTLFSAAIAQGLITVIALVVDFGNPSEPMMKILGVNGFFITLWLGSALLFRNAALPTDKSE